MGPCTRGGWRTCLPWAAVAWTQAGTNVEETGATRTRLLATRAQIDLATRGRDLLVDKRNHLMRAFQRTADVVLAGSDELERTAAEAARRLAWAEALAGPEAVGSAATAASGEIFLAAGSVSIMGVRVPEIERRPVGRPRTGRGYSLAGTGGHVDAVAEGFEGELDLVVELAAGEMRLRRLATEIGATTRRVNALEHVVIPRLRRRFREIGIVLGEREREDHFRLRRARARRRVRTTARGGTP